MNTWEAYKDAEDRLRGATENGQKILSDISRHLQRHEPLTSQWVQDRLLALKLQVGFIAGAAAMLEAVEGSEARRDLTHHAPQELILVPAP